MFNESQFGFSFGEEMAHKHDLAYHDEYVPEDDESLNVPEWADEEELGYDDYEDDADEHDHFRDDVDADADTLRMAGYGTDEDYGDYGQWDAYDDAYGGE